MNFLLSKKLMFIYGFVIGIGVILLIGLFNPLSFEKRKIINFLNTGKSCSRIMKHFGPPSYMGEINFSNNGEKTIENTGKILIFHIGVDMTIFIICGSDDRIKSFAIGGT